MSAPSERMRKRDKVFKLFRPASPDTKVNSQSGIPKDVKQNSIAETDTIQHHRLSTVSTNSSTTCTITESAQSNAEIEHVVTNTAIKGPVVKIKSSTLKTKLCLDVFKHNVNPPSAQVSLPEIYTRFDDTHQLALCIALLNKCGRDAAQQEDLLQGLHSDTTARLTWLQAVKQDPIEQDRIRWLGICMVDDFANDASKDSTEIAEMVLLGPALDSATHRRLLQYIITAFDQFTLLDVDLLQGMVQLVQSAPSESLLCDDLVKILSILRVRLQDTHQQSSVHPFHLTLAVSRMLDAMADHKVKDLNRVVEHEPLSGVLSGLKDSLDPYLMYQACYAFQALQYVRSDETALQSVLRHSTGVLDGLVKVSAILKLDVGSVLEGLGSLQKAIGDAIDTAVTVYGGVSSLLESGRGIIEGLKEGLRSGQKRPWYFAIRAANALAQAGQLKDLNQLIYEAPCRRDPLFQWGICQLLGEIASDGIWDTNIRQQAITLLGDLYMNDVEWGQDESVRVWMLRIIGQFSTIDDSTVKNTAHVLLQELKNDHDTVSSLPYPLRNRLPLPTSSPILARVQNIPYVEYDLHLHKAQRLEQSTQSIYIPPLAKPSLNAKDQDLFQLMEKVLEFLQSKRQVMLVLGDSGSGKSTFNRHLEHRLWNDYKKGAPIPVFINLPGIRKPEDDMITKQLRIYNFKDDQIQELKLHRQLILICDGYDESQQLVNLHKTNMLNQRGQWNTKMIISCRTQFLGPAYLDRFKPELRDRYTSDPQDDFQEAVIAPFTKDQIKDYVEKYAQDPRTRKSLNSQFAWTAKEYMAKLAAIPNIMDLVKNPFLLTLALKALPGLVASNKNLASIRVTRVGLYDMFICQWLEMDKVRLRTSTLSQDELKVFNLLADGGFSEHGIDYLVGLAEAIFKNQDGHSIVHYTPLQDRNSWKAAYFGNEPTETKLLRDASPLVRTGNEYRFIHRSVLEYFLSCAIYNPTKVDKKSDPPAAPRESLLLNSNNLIFRQNLLKESSVVSFLGDRVEMNPAFKHQLRAVIDLSKTDSNAAIAATNAITILVRAGVSFNDEDLQDVKVPGADLSNGQFDSARFQRADLTGVNLSKSWLRQADMSDAHMEDVRFGELPYLEMEDAVYSCAYSTNGVMLAVALYNGNIYIYDIVTWSNMLQLKGHKKAVTSIVFTSDSKRLVSCSSDKTVRLWDATRSEALLVMEGHKGNVHSVTISPCGNRIASASSDKTVRVWNVLTGESLFVFEEHKSSVMSVKYSPDGKQLVSSSLDGTIRFWNPRTGEQENLLKSSGKLRSLAYSPKARWYAAGHERGRLQLWNAITLESGPILSGHIANITDIDFSPDGRWIASSSDDHTAKVWDASTGTLVTDLTGHNHYVNCVSCSPDGKQIATGGYDHKVRLWEVAASWSSTDPRDGGSAMELAYSCDGRSILSYDEDGVFRQWDAATGTSTPIPFEMPEEGEIKSRVYSPDGSQLAFGYSDGSIRLWNCQTGTAGIILEGHSERIKMLVYSPCRRWIVSVDASRAIRLWDLHLLWDLDDPELQSVLIEANESLDGDIRTVAFRLTGDQFAIGAEEGIICLFDTQSRECLGRVRLDGAISLLVYSPNGLQLAIGAGEGKFYLWDLQSKEPGAILDGHNGWVRCIAYSPCGQWIASASNDKTVGIWSRQLLGGVETWSNVGSICAFFGWVVNVSWNPVVAKELVTCCNDGSVQVWRMSTDKSGKADFKMTWGPNLGVLYIKGAIFKNAVGLSPIRRKLLAQRGAFCLSDELASPID